MLLRHDDQVFDSDADNEDAHCNNDAHDSLLIDDNREEASVSLPYLFALTCGVGGSVAIVEPYIMTCED